ncbi:hypothetical protein EB796_014269 [Bugula neritina]|uniref:Uncharacterized protein n=1 Tax=Bugula neritina TaxID=10212 RepID=A0A7J7JP28_BUGNE|nr:hypothetical protein EB796_014269 [Bugula neritina]
MPPKFNRVSYQPDGSVSSEWIDEQEVERYCEHICEVTQSSSRTFYWPSYPWLPDAVNRTELMNQERKLRPKRSVDCNDVCADVDGFGDMCSYDCLAAQESGTEDDVVVSSYSSVEEVVSSVVESPSVDQELIAEAVDEVESFTEVPTTTPSPGDLQASGGVFPVEGMEEALNEAAEMNIAEDEEQLIANLQSTTLAMMPDNESTIAPTPMTKLEKSANISGDRDMASTVIQSAGVTPSSVADSSTTQPLTTESTTQPPATKPPSSEPPTTKPLTTKPLTTKPLTTKPLTTKPLTTKPLTTKPSTSKPSTNAPTEQVSVTSTIPVTEGTTPFINFLNNSNLAEAFSHGTTPQPSVYTTIMVILICVLSYPKLKVYTKNVVESNVVENDGPIYIGDYLDKQEIDRLIVDEDSSIEDVFPENSAGLLEKVKFTKGTQSSMPKPQKRSTDDKLNSPAKDNPYVLKEYLFGLNELSKEEREKYDSLEKVYLKKSLHPRVEEKLYDSIYSVACPAESNRKFLEQTLSEMNITKSSAGYQNSKSEKELYARFKHKVSKKVVSVDHKKTEFERAVQRTGLTESQKEKYLPTELLKVFQVKKILNLFNMRLEFAEELHSFYMFVLNGPASQKLSDWDAFEDVVDGKSKYSIQGARHPNMTALQVVQRFFRSEPEIKCSNAIQLYQSLKEGKEKILLKKPSAEKEQTLGFTNLLQATTSVMGFVKRKIVVNESFCGEDKSKLQSLTSFDHLATMVPILSYAKNAIGRKFFKPDSMLHQLLTKNSAKSSLLKRAKQFWKKKMFLVLTTFPDMCVTSAVFLSQQLRFFDILTPCMQNSMEAEAESSACGIRWPDVKPWMETLPLRMCTRDSSGFIPSQPALKVLKANYGYAFSFLSCFLHDSDKLHNASSLSEAFQLEPLEKAIETCHADKFVGRLEGIFSAILKSNRDKEMDIMKIVDTIQTTANTTAAALRCLAKHLHPFCAQRKVDLGAAMKQVLPMISIGTFGIVNIPTKVSDYKAKLSLKTNDRVTLAVVGDPHVKSLKNPDKFETCSELEYFTYKSKYLYGSTDSPENFTFPKATFPTTTLDFTSTTPMPMPEYMSTTETPELESGADTDLLVAPEKTVLISNDWFRVEGTLARWSSSVTGTFFKEVKFIVGEQVSDDKADYVTYTFNSLTDLEYAPRFETSKKLSSGEVSLGEDAGVQFEGLTSVQSLPLRIYTQEVKGQKRVVIKELKSGTVIAFSNPSGEIVNTYVRSSRPLLEASTGLLVDGCPDAVDRSEVINKEKELRPQEVCGLQ